MIGEKQPIKIQVRANTGTVQSSEAVSIGLIVTELLINAIKYAFPVSKSGAQIIVTYEVDGTDWRLIVSDNGIGSGVVDVTEPKGGLGTAIVGALAKQLDARVAIARGAAGRSVSITRGVFSSHLPQAA